MKKTGLSRSVFWGMVLILTAALLILNGFGISLGEGFTPVRIIAGVLLVAWILYDLFRVKIERIFFPLAFLFLIYEPLIARWVGREGEDLLSAWIVLLCALLLTIGVNLIKGSRTSGKEKNSKHIGNSTLYLDANDPDACVVKENLGNVTVYFVNAENYRGGATLHVQNNLGEITLHVPSDWTVTTDASDNLGQVRIPERDVVSDKVLHLKIHDNLGRIRVLFD